MPNETDIRAKVVGSIVTREMNLETSAIDEKARTATFSFSSETPVTRWWGEEILDHDPGSVRMDRMKDGAPLLLDHRTDRHIGVIERASIDEDRRGRATARFSQSKRGKEIFQDVVDGIRRKISVGYIVHEMKLEESDDNKDFYRIIDWEPLEASLTAIPADAQIGVGRNFSNQRKSNMPFVVGPDETDDTVNADDTVNTDDVKPTIMTDETSEKAPSQDTQREMILPPENSESAQIRAVGAHFGMRDLAEDHIMLGGTLEQFRDKVRTQRPDPVPAVAKIDSRIPYAGSLRSFRPDLYAGGRKEAEEQAYRAGHFCRAIVFGNETSFRWCRDNGVQLGIPGKDMLQARVMTGLAAGQSAVVPDELVLPIINLREQYGVARRLCQIHPMSSDTASVPRRTSGATAYFVGREEAPTATDPGLDNVQLVARNVAAETRISNDYADDSVINLADYIADEHALAFSTKEDSCLIDGDGTSTYGGIVGIRTGILGLAGAIDAALGNDTFLEIESADLDGVVGALPEIPGIMPYWIASKRGEALIFGRLRTAAGGNTKTDLATRAPKTWDGDEIVISQAMPKGTGSTDYSDVVMAIYGDLGLGVMFGDRRGMTMLSDPYSLSSYQQTKIIHSERFDINVHGLGDASTAGPIVALVGE